MFTSHAVLRLHPHIGGTLTPAFGVMLQFHHGRRHLQGWDPPRVENKPPQKKALETCLLYQIANINYIKKQQKTGGDQILPPFLSQMQNRPKIIQKPKSPPQPSPPPRKHWNLHDSPLSPTSSPGKIPRYLSTKIHRTKSWEKNKGPLRLAWQPHSLVPAKCESLSRSGTNA